MTEKKSLEYIELDIPFCTRTYGVAPCNARLISATDPIAASLDGTSTNYLKRGAGLTGAADGKTVVFSCWIRKHVDVGAGGYVISGTTTLNGSTYRFAVVLTSDDRVTFFAYNAAGTLILDARSNSTIRVGRWVHVLAAFDMANSAAHQIYLDDVADVLSPVATFTNDTIDFTVADWAMAALPSGLGKLDISLADLWLAPGVWLDLAVTLNRRLFIDATGNPVSLGATGSTPTGTPPLVFLSGDIAAWHTNKGSGGGFTLTGTLTEDDFGSGAVKCFNSKATCQDTANYNAADVTLRFTKPAAYLPDDIEAIPSVSDISFTPATISLGKNLGTRATLQVTFKDHPHSDTGNGYDKYLADRDYDPYSQGSYWGKFRSRQPYLRGLAMRWKSGLIGDALADMDIRHFLVDSFDGLTPDGKFSILAKDVLKLAAGDRAQAPVLSTGYLSADITASATSATLLPAGIGNSEYEASGYLCIGGNEVVSFTRSGDTLTIARGALGTTASTHKAQDRVQTVLRYAASDPADIIYGLLLNYAGVDASYITLADWRAETATFLGTLYTANICEPTSVDLLVSELMEQAALAIWDDNSNQLLRLQVLRGINTDAATFTPQNYWEKSLTIKEQPEQRLSRVQTYFGIKDPTKPLSNLDNYRSTSLVIDTEAETNYGAAAIKTITSRWIPEAGRTVADRLGAVILGRYRDPPRRVTFATMRHAETDVDLGQGYRIESYCIQDETGAQDNIPIQVTRLNPGPDRFLVEAEEMLWTAPAADLTDRQIVYDANNYNINLRTSHDSIYPTPVAGDVVTFTINAGVVIGSVSTSLPAINVGTWPTGVTLTLIVNKRIEGKGALGGNGGTEVSNGTAGLTGGTALYTRYPINLELPAGGEIWSGGGGGGGGGFAGGSGAPAGGGGGGGGGAGQDAGGGGTGGVPAGGTPGAAGSAGTATAGGAPGAGGVAAAGPGGVGGGPGLAGAAGTNGSGVGATLGGPAGPAGSAIDGVSYVTTTVSGGDIRGGQVN